MHKVAQAFPPEDGFLTDDERIALEMRSAQPPPGGLDHRRIL
jgi:hypothetical protein